MPDVNLLASETKRNLLRLIKRRGEIALDDAIEATGYARTTLREHLNQLERDGLVRRRSERRGRGRPRHRYQITERGEQLFPSRDGVLLRELIKYLEENDREILVEDFFESFWSARVDEVNHRMRQAGVRDMDERLAVLERFLEEEGFMPDVEHQAGQLVIRECNCPFSEAVKQTSLPCQLEAQFYEVIFGTAVERIGYIPEGDEACTYEIEEAARSEQG